MLNGVYDPVYDTYDESCFRLNLIGPIEPGEIIANPGSSKGYDVSGVEICKYVLVPQVFVEYMDGTSEIIYYAAMGQGISVDDGYSV